MSRADELALQARREEQIRMRLECMSLEEIATWIWRLGRELEECKQEESHAGA